MPVSTHQVEIPDCLHGARLDLALAKLIPDFSRAQHQKWIKEGHVWVDQSCVCLPRHSVEANQTLLLNAHYEIVTSNQAQNIPLDICYEDAALLVLNKPVGLVVHPGAGQRDNTLLNALLYHCPSLSALPRAGIVHRLDKDTTGLLVVAKTLEAHHHLVQQLQQRSVRREYLAIVNGVPTAGRSINLPLGRHPRIRTKMAVVPSGKVAVSHVRVIERYNKHALVRVSLETGRTHQIRVHMAHIHHPLVGDALYGRAHDGLEKYALSIDRQALHATRLTLEHPETREQMTWEANLPEDMQAVLLGLRQNINHT